MGENKSTFPMSLFVIYLLHFNQPLGSSQHQAWHYLGLTQCLTTRLTQHAQGSGAAITRALIRQGGTFQCVRTWQGGRDTERKLKARKNHKLLCPLCFEHASRYGLYYLHAGQRVPLEANSLL
jgi:hypothetical protein